MKPKKFCNVKAKNVAQAEALAYLTDPEVHLVILEGVAGSGKTFLALAAGLRQVLEIKLYKEIIFTRAPIALGTDLGSLPGTEEEKLGPWCGALKDNIEALVGSDGLALARVESKISIKALQFMRGRSLQDKYLIIDEVQNLSPSEVKVLITRAAEGTKIVAMGDISQIDNRRLTREDNGLTSLIVAEEYVPSPYVKCVFLPESERSELCKWGSVAL